MENQKENGENIDMNFYFHKSFFYYFFYLSGFLSAEYSQNVHRLSIRVYLPKVRRNRIELNAKWL